MQTVRKILFCLFAVTLTLQLIGVEQAFCDDSVLEANCQDCTTCALNPLASTPLFSLVPAAGARRFMYPLEPVSKIEEPTFSLLRPPILS